MKSLDINKENSVLVVVDEIKTTSPLMLKLVKEALDEGKLCYISVTKTYDYIQKVFEEHEMDISKIRFIDCISHSFQHTDDNPNVDFVTAPRELDELAEAIKGAIDKGYSHFFLDSLSAMTGVVAAGNDHIKAFYDLFAELLKGKDGRILFMCSFEDEEKLLIQEAMPVFEKIVHVHKQE
ncbi:hypothetical protein ACFL3V_04105 [Nanoarchaeota archaeon]